jgi:uncharacterized iron-regulated membrane protein
MWPATIEILIFGLGGILLVVAFFVTWLRRRRADPLEEDGEEWWT